MARFTSTNMVVLFIFRPNGVYFPQKGFDSVVFRIRKRKHALPPWPNSWDCGAPGLRRQEAR